MIVLMGILIIKRRHNVSTYNRCQRLFLCSCGGCHALEVALLVSWCRDAEMFSAAVSLAVHRSTVEVNENVLLAWQGCR